MTDKQRSPEEYPRSRLQEGDLRHTPRKSTRGIQDAGAPGTNAV
jgi:hypothetical protein